MRGTGKGLILLIMAVILANVAAAADFEVNPVPQKNKIGVTEFAVFNLSVTNNGDKEDDFRIYTLDYPTWEIRTSPLINPIKLTIGPGETKSVVLEVYPLYVNTIGTYYVNLNVKNERTGEMIKAPLLVSIQSTAGLIGGYVPTVLANVLIPKSIDPRNEVVIQLSLDNQNLIDYKELQIEMNSRLINIVANTSLGPKEQKSLIFRKQLDPLTPPQTDRFIVTVKMGNMTIVNPISTKMEITAYSELEKESKVVKSFLKKEQVIVYGNAGNEAYKGNVSVEISPVAGLFTSTEPKALKIEKQDKTYLQWEIELEPEQGFTVVIKTNYRPLMVIIVLAIILIIVYYSYRSPLVVTKEAANIEKREGGVAEFKVIISVKNRGNKPLRDIEVTEFIPRIVEVQKELSLGTLQPYKVMHNESKGLTMKWKIDDLDLADERVLTYRIKSKLAILGEFSLGAAYVSYRIDNKEKVTHSNRLVISA